MAPSIGDYREVEKMAYRFPGRPPGTDLSDSFSMASSIGDYIEEGNGAYRTSAADFLAFEEEQNRLQPQQQQQQQYPGENNCTFFFPPGMPQYRYSKKMTYGTTLVRNKTNNIRNNTKTLRRRISSQDALQALFHQFTLLCTSILIPRLSTLPTLLSHLRFDSRN